MLNNIEIITTNDGSHTLLVNHLNEHYHSINGAITESKHVYIEAALNYVNATEVAVFEVGFGTGLNAFLSFYETEKKPLKIYYDTIEKYPLSKEIYSILNYSEIIDKKYNNTFLLINNCEWNKPVDISKQFILYKINNDICHYTLQKTYDIVFFDAFAPQIQPEIWSYQIFCKIFECLNFGGVLTTYCVKGSIKRMLKEIGFTVEVLPGAPGKLHMLRAIKN